MYGKNARMLCLLLASGNVADSSSDELKLSSAQIRLSYNQDLHALSAKLATDTNVKNLNSQLETISGDIQKIQMVASNGFDLSSTLNDICQAGDIAHSILSAAQSSGGASSHAAQVPAGGAAAGAIHGGGAASATTGVANSDSKSAGQIACSTPQTPSAQTASNASTPSTQ
jgi:hypothetical protein